MSNFENTIPNELRSKINTTQKHEQAEALQIQTEIKTNYDVPWPLTMAVRY